MVDGVRLPGWTAGLSPEKFSGQFSGEFFLPKKDRFGIVCALVRLWLGFVRL
jgi:hypothetical protein